MSFLPSMFADRADAGRAVAERVKRILKGRTAVVLALPRGGVPVALEVAMVLNAPLDVFLVRKLGVPGYEELAFGAIASGGTRILNRDVIAESQLSAAIIDRVTACQKAELERRESAYRRGREVIPIGGENIVVVDDGLATGASMRAAVKAIRSQGANWIAVDVPVGPLRTRNELSGEADKVICDTTPANFEAVGQWYRNFQQVSEEDVSSMLRSWKPGRRK